jgi:hypothetical protein
LRSKTSSHRRFRRTEGRHFGAILLLTLFCVVPAAAQGQGAIVRTEPTASVVGAGQMTSVTFVLADVQNAYGIDVRATFDPKFVEVVDADPAKDGIQMSPGTFPQPDFVARNVADNQAGTLRYAITQVNPTEPASGTGVILAVQFRGKAAGETALKLDAVELANRQGQLLPAVFEGGSIRVVADRAPMPVSATAQPAPAAEPTAQTVPTVSQAETAQPAAAPAFPGGLPCTGSVLAPSLGLLGLARWATWRRGR